LISWREQQDRLYRVAAPLLMQNTELCPRHARNLLGFTAKTRHSYSDEFIEEAQEIFGLDDRLRITNVLPDGSAALAGIQEGDFFLTAGIEPMPEGPNAEREAAALIASELQGRTSFDLTILRDGERLSLEVPLTPACAMIIDLGNSDDVNSYADGHRVMITKGMLNFVQSDEELAYVLAREIADNVLMQTPRADIGGVIDHLRTLSARPPSAKSGTPDMMIAPFTPDLDAAADELALYILARAGYGIDNVFGFWKRLATAYPASIANSHTALHPAIDHRLSVIDQVVKTIHMKRDNGMALAPERS